MKCRVCREAAIIDIRRHNANFCAEHFLKLCRDQTMKAIDEFDMIAVGERVLVAVSGGKDSLAIWDLLLDLGFAADGLYLGLGIGEYSDASAECARAFAASRDVRLIEVDLPSEYGYDIPTGARAAKRVPCSACGLSKRHLFDQAAIDGGYDVVVTGHNLDDEAAVLFGNVLRWQTDYLGRQLPVLPARHGFPRKVKPLVRLGEREMAAYCVVKGIDYIVEECPMAAGNKHLGYKAALNAIEETSPGTKHDFYFGFLSRASAYFRPVAEGEQADLLPCTSCGAPTTAEVCAFCRLVERAGGHLPSGDLAANQADLAAPVSVVIGTRPGDSSTTTGAQL
ncbi:MAG: ATP-binding protein [Actinomycetes bacterium]